MTRCLNLGCTEHPKRIQRLGTRTLRELQVEAHSCARAKGWWDTDFLKRPLESIALMHSELSEAAEAWRKGDAENFQEELADVVIRILDFCGYEHIDLQAAIEKKIKANWLRSIRHGGKRA